MNVPKLIFRKWWLWLIIIVVIAGGVFILINRDTEPNENELNDNETEQIRSYADPITENILLAINEDDYIKYSEHFSEIMKNAITESLFKGSNVLIKSKIGDYLSKEFWKTEKQGRYSVVYYKAKFSQESEVIVKVIFQEVEDKILVAGLWFDSPKLQR